MKQSYKIINLEQGSEEWKAFRRTKVTSTDVSCFFGEHLSFSTQYALWSNKKNGSSIFVSEAMKRGSREESRAMNFLKQKTGVVFSPCVVLSEKYPIMSSLDGMDFDGNYLAEIKVPNQAQESDMWEKALRGIVPKPYRYQIQTSLMITGAKKCYFFVFDGAFDGVLVEVFPDYKMWKEIIEKSVEFHCRYIKGDEIPGDKADEIEREDEAFLSVAQDYVKIDSQIKELTKQKNNLKAELIKMAGDGVTTTGGGVRVAFSCRTSPNDIKQLVKDMLPEIDLDDLPEKYQGKPGTPSPTLTIVKRKKQSKNIKKLQKL